MSRVLLASNTARYLYNFRSGLIAALRDRGHKVIAVAPWDEYSARLAAAGCEVVDLPMDNKGTNPLRDMHTLLDFWRVLRNHRPDAALFFTVKPVIYGSLASRLLAVPAISTITGLGTAILRNDWLTRVVERLYRVSLRWPVKIFFQNEDDHRLFVERGLVCGEKAERVPGSGVDLRRFGVAPPAANPAPVFLLSGRLLRDKGVGEFIEAARRVKANHPGTVFQLLGSLGVANSSAISEEQVDAWVKEGVISYLGETDNVVPFIAAADCVVLPSYREGTSRTLLEASAMARPIVTTEVPGCRQIVEDGVTGLLCRPKDPADLMEKIETMIALGPAQRAEMGRKGRQKMEREFDERIVLERYLAAIDQALNKGGRGS
jgi:glycosyltransferase involved in cell wall biosynthesis